MVHTNIASAAAAAASRSPLRLSSSEAFHAGASIPQRLPLSPYEHDNVAAAASSGRRFLHFQPAGTASRRQSSHRYHTFPTPPPRTPSDVEGERQREGEVVFRSAQLEDYSGYRGGGEGESEGVDEDDNDSDSSSATSPHYQATPLPWKQLCLLALLSLAEQTALNSISPYLPEMVSSFHELPPDQTGLYVGLLASAFALAQLATNLLWGYLSDVVGRKPVMLLGTSLLAACFIFFGLCTTYIQLIAVHVAMGLLNGNAALVPTCLGEVTDRSNQSRAFTWLPVMYSIGGITGPALGGLLVGENRSNVSYPFLAPNIASAVLLAVSVLALGVWFEETLDGAEKTAAGAGLAWVEKLFQCSCLQRRRTRGCQGSWSSRWPTSGQPAAESHHAGDSSEDYVSESGDNFDATDVDENQRLLSSPVDCHHDEGSDGDGKHPSEQKAAVFRQLTNRTTLTVLITYLVFQLANISFNSLYPIFASAPPPTGRKLGPGTIGLSLSFAGLTTIVFQISVFQPLKAKMGNLGTYRAALLGLAVSMAIMPWIGYSNDQPWLGLGAGKAWLYTELGVVLVVKNVCAVGGLSSVMLLITNSAPSHEVLGTLNGIAQTLSAAGRSIGPFLSGGMFTLSTRVRPKGEALTWGLFAGIALTGWLGALSIRGNGLESGDWEGSENNDDCAEA